MIVRVDRHASGPRLYVGGRRVHHGSAGIGAIALGLALRRPRLTIAGAIALAHDRRDFPFTDNRNH
jgi:hypothetical protein